MLGTVGTWARRVEGTAPKPVNKAADFLINLGGVIRNQAPGAACLPGPKPSLYDLYYTLHNIVHFIVLVGQEHQNALYARYAAYTLRNFTICGMHFKITVCQPISVADPNYFCIDRDPTFKTSGSGS
jgi:hypothetical protein